MPDRFEVIDLAEWTRGESEPGGDEAKRWFHAPASSPHQGHWLFKPRREKLLQLSAARELSGEKPGTLIRGDDWAEKISYELATLIRVPAARTELAKVIPLSADKPVPGSMSRDMRPLHWAWTPGAALLAELDADFDADSCLGHSPESILVALDGLHGPVDTEYDDWAAFDVFAGFLMLDAWIANTDRHAHNWGVLQDPESGTICLGPSFDHGSALGSGIGDDVRARKVADAKVGNWCGRGRTKRFDGGVAVNLVDLAARGMTLASYEARRHWDAQIRHVDLDICFDVISAVPDLSDPTRTFLRTALATNRKRLTDVLR